MSLGAEAGSPSLDNPPVFGRDGPKEPTSQTRSAQCTVDHEASQTEISFMPHAVLVYCTSV